MIGFKGPKMSKNKIGGYIEVFSNEKGLEEISKPLVLLGAEDEI